MQCLLPNINDNVVQNQLPLSASFQRENIDHRVKPFKIYRTYVGAGLV